MLGCDGQLPVVATVHDPPGGAADDHDREIQQNKYQHQTDIVLLVRRKQAISGHITNHKGDQQANQINDDEVQMLHPILAFFLIHSVSLLSHRAFPCAIDSGSRDKA